MIDSATIFIVDDDASIRSSMERLIRSAGYRTETFDSAEEFIEFDSKYDVQSCLILDVKMPEKNGLELQKYLTQHNFSIPIIFISGCSDIRTSVTAMKMGARDFLTKPFEDEELLAAVRGALENDMMIKAIEINKEQISRRFNNLTEREYEIMTYVISGMLNKQIAAALGISEKTVKVHRARVYSKVGVDSVAELVRLTEKLGIDPVSISG